MALSSGPARRWKGGAGVACPPPLAQVRRERLRCDTRDRPPAPRSPSMAGIRSQAERRLLRAPSKTALPQRAQRSQRANHAVGTTMLSAPPGAVAAFSVPSVFSVAHSVRGFKGSSSAARLLHVRWGAWPDGFHVTAVSSSLQRCHNSSKPPVQKKILPMRVLVSPGHRSDIVPVEWMQ